MTPRGEGKSRRRKENARPGRPVSAFRIQAGWTPGQPVNAGGPPRGWARFPYQLAVLLQWLTHLQLEDRVDVVSWAAKGKQMTPENKKRMLIELRVSRNLDRKGMLAFAADELQSRNLTIDTNYPPVPMKPRREDASKIGTDEAVVVIRATVAAGEEAILARHPQVLRVWDDTPVSPMDSEEESPAGLGWRPS